MVELFKCLLPVYFVKSQISCPTAQTPVILVFVCLLMFISFICDLVNELVDEKCKALHAALMHHVSKKQDWYRASWNAGSLES